MAAHPGHREGREVRYTVLPERLDATAQWMIRIAAEWDARFAAIKRIAEAGANVAAERPGRPGRASR